MVMKRMELPAGLTMTRGGEYQECSFGRKQVVCLSMRKFNHLTIYRSNSDGYNWRTLIESSRSR